MTYREHAATGRWRREVVCAWTSVSGPLLDMPNAVVPDGCADLLWSSSRGAVVVGPMTRPSVPTFPPGTEHVALRLRPGRTERLLGVPASALTDLEVPLVDVLGVTGHELEARLGAATDTADRLAVLRDLPGVSPAADVDRPALAGLAWLVDRPGRQVEQAAAHAQLSRRQFHRRVVAAIGYGPKRFQRVIRVQRVLAAAPRRAGDLAGLAAELGFADQAHLTREVGLLTGRPPSALAGARATLVSGTSKPTEPDAGRLWSPVGDALRVAATDDRRHAS